MIYSRARGAGLLRSAALLMALAGCGDGGTNTPGPSGEITLDDAWSVFEVGEYSDAVILFYEILAREPSSLLAESGLGWSFAFQGELDSAATHFAVAAAGSSDAETYAGYAAVLLAVGNREGAIEMAEAALLEDPSWVFVHFEGVDYRDLRVILASAFFGQGPEFFVNAQEEVDRLAPDNGLSPGDPESWNGHPSYAAAILSEIQQIEAKHGAEILL